MQQAWPDPRPPSTPPYRCVAGNLTQALANYALVSPAGTMKQMHGLTLISSGVRYAVFNAAILEEPVVTTIEELTSRLVAASGFFLRLGMPWSCWVCRDHLSVQVRSLADLVFQRHRLRYIAEHLGLETDRLQPQTRKLPLIDVRPVTTSDTRRDFASVTGETFELPPNTSREIYDGPGLWRGDYLGYVGYSGTSPVCTAATVTAAGAIGLYSVGTVFAYRGRGYAEAITRSAIGDAAKGGPHHNILQSTPAGLALYQRLGYRPVTSVMVYAMV